MRVVVDTNVLVSGLLSPHGPPGRVIDLFLDGALTLLVDDRIVLEYRDVLTRPRFTFAPGDVAAVLALVDLVAERVPAAPLDLVVDDPDDLAFVEVAHAGCAKALITGNTRHVRAASEIGVRVVSPAAFVKHWP